MSNSRINKISAVIAKCFHRNVNCNNLLQHHIKNRCLLDEDSNCKFGSVFLMRTPIPVNDNDQFAPKSFL